MAIVAPSILSADFSRLGEEVLDVLGKGAEWVHIDVMDGHFVPNITIGPLVVKALKPIVGDAVMDCHLMIENPDLYVADFQKAGADLITVHAEACVHLHRSIQAIHGLGIKAGVALNPHTPPSVLDYVLDDLDLVLIMTVNPGFGGQSLVESALRKITLVREEIERRCLSTLVEVDGGVKAHNVHLFTDAGAQVLVSGSGVFGAADRAAAIAALKG
ncbi:MAG: ribulose-phosphate 3-epimerase [Gemmatimonadales bacterium]|jgi:ribulose-phosphate 3-epimerase|nr:ribulose-phosphate 3-epimerase [Gemmatimonadales bacterium]